MRINELDAQAKTEQIRVRLSPDAKRLIMAAARQRELNLAAYIRQYLYDLIREIPSEDVTKDASCRISLGGDIYHPSLRPRRVLAQRGVQKLQLRSTTTYHI